MTGVHTTRSGPAAVITLDHAPVNCLSQPMRYALWTAIEVADADQAVQGIVITGAGRGFCGGGDLGESRPRQQDWPGISNHLLPRIEAGQKPVLAAMHGFAVGGGLELELALACHYRVAQRDTRLALPERAHSFDAGLAASKRLHDQLAGLPANGVALKGATS